MKKILKLILLLLFIGIVVALDFWLVWTRGWPWWVGGAILLGLIGLWVSFLFLKRYLLRRREKQFVHRVVELDEGAIKGARPEEREQLRELQDHWKESVGILRNSYLRRRFGSPLYTLPWYLVIGESGSGKTTAIKNSNLHSPVSDLTRTAGISATRNCDWWFFEEAIILDTAGRYTIPTDRDRDEEEWEKFLVLLAKYRRREPINGVIATISADKLLSQDKAGLRADGQSVRRRIDQLMRVTGARFPVYILVTKMDMVYGFADTFLSLSEEDTHQAAGYLDKAGKLPFQTIIDSAFATILKRLDRIRRDLVHGPGPVKPGVLLLADEFQRLRPGLTEYVKTVFEENPYQEKPFLRGLYFSSARQTAHPEPAFLEASNPSLPPKVAKGSDRGLFLRDLFANVLPRDRYLYTPVYEFIRWRRFTHSLGFLSALLLLLALSALLSFSFLRNVATIKAFTHEFPRPPLLKTELTADLLLLDRYRSRVLDLEKGNKGWLIPRFGLDGSLKVEQKAKRDFVDLFNRGFQWRFDKDLYRRIDDVDIDTDPDTMADYAGYLLTRIHVLKSFVKGAKVDKIEYEIGEYADFNRMCARLVESLNPDLPGETAQTVAGAYTTYLTWNENRAEIERSLELLQAAFVSLQRRHPDLTWLATKAVLNVPDVGLADLWGKTMGGRFEDVAVPGAYTVEGQKRIHLFMKAMETAAPGGRLSENLVGAFWKQYRQRYYQAWYTFCTDFIKSGTGFENQSSLQDVAALMATDQNPYWLLIARAAEELAPTEALTDPPTWTQLMIGLNEIVKLSQKGDEKGDQKAKQSTLSKLEEAKEKLLQGMKKVDPREVKEEKDTEALERRQAIAKIVGDYRKSLGQIAPLVVSRENSFRMVSDVFSEQAILPDTKSPFHSAYLSFMSVKTQMREMGTKGGDVVWQLFGGPFNFLLSYGTSKTCFLLQERWEGDVIGRTENVPKEKLTKTLFDKADGIVWKFREGPAKPFISRDRWGYVARKAYEKTIFEHSIPFQPDFLHFLSSGERSIIEQHPDYEVRLETLPILVNDEATVKPHGNIVSVQCAETENVLRNYNYPEKKTFRWSVEKCGATTLKILFPELVLTRTYGGQMGFIEFLKDFKTGSHTFSVDAFPEQKGRLEAMGVRWVQVRYRIQQAPTIVDPAKEPASRIPRVITRCAPGERAEARAR